MKNKSEEILNKLKEEGKLIIISKEETAKINNRINSEIKKLRKNKIK
jgi:hypothetical protein